MGPLITKDHLNKVSEYIQSGIDDGAKIINDGRISIGDQIKII